MKPRIYAIAAAAVVLLAAGAASAGEGPLARMENAVKSLAAKVTPSVVGVELVHANFPGSPPKPGTMEHLVRQKLLQNSGGSGFAISESRVVSCGRAVPPGIDTVRVVLPTGKYLKAKVIGRSDEDDVILLEVEGGKLQPLEFRTSSPKIGEFVMSVGNSFAVTSRMWRHAYSLGVVSGFYEVKQGFNAYYSGQVIETDAAINPGNFGGPLVDRQGRVVGLTISSFSHRRWLGTAVPAARVMEAVARITGEKSPAIRPEGAFEVAAAGIALSEDGMTWVVASVAREGIGAIIGLVPGDRIVSVNGAAPKGGEAQALRAFAPGAKVRMEIERKGFRFSYEFTLPAAEDEDSEF